MLRRTNRISFTNPIDYTLLPIAGVKFTDGMIVLLKEDFGNTVNERLFRTSGGGFGASPDGLGKAFGAWVETGREGYIRRNDVLGIYRGPLPDVAPAFYRKPAGYWISKMPELIKFFTGYDKKNEQNKNRTKERELARDIIDGAKEIDVALQQKDKIATEKAKREGRNVIYVTPSFMYAINLYIGILRMASGKKSASAIGRASEGLMEIAEQLDSFNEDAPHTNPHGGRSKYQQEECPQCGGAGEIITTEGRMACYKCGVSGEVLTRLHSRGELRRSARRAPEQERHAFRQRRALEGYDRDYSEFEHNPRGDSEKLIKDAKKARKEADYARAWALARGKKAGWAAAWDRYGVLNARACGLEAKANRNPHRPTDKAPVRVAFRVFPKGHTGPEDMGGDIIALFPDLQWDYKGNIASYMHVGQHSGADPALVREFRPATPTEYADLKAELERIGYTVRVLNSPHEYRHNKDIRGMGIGGSSIK